MCGIGLPVAPVAGDLNGIRIGTQEVTRFDMDAAAMAEIAKLMARVMVHKEEPAKVRRDVIAFRKNYQTLRFLR
jgi:glycine hydroxymethyltransferase